MVSTRNYPNVKNQKEEILSLLSEIRETIIETNPPFKQLVDAEGFDKVVKAMGCIPITNSTDLYETLTNNGFDIDSHGYIKMKTFRGEFTFGVSSVDMIEKLTKRGFPISNNISPTISSKGITGPAHVASLRILDKDGSYKTKDQILADADLQIETMKENISQAKKIGSIKLIQLYQKEIELLKKARTEAENTDFEELEVERYMRVELPNNPLMVLAKGNKNHTTLWNLEFGKKLIEFNMLGYKLPEGKYTDDLYQVLAAATELKEKYPNKPLSDIIKEGRGEVMMLEDEQIGRYYSEKLGRWKQPKGRSQERDFYGRKQRIFDLEKRLNLIQGNTLLFNIALGNKPFNVRGSKQPEVIVPSKMVDAPLLAKILTDAIVMTTESIKSIQDMQTKKVLAIDIETYSPVDLKESGLYAYAEHPEFEVLLFAYAFDKDPVTVVDLALFEDVPEEVFLALHDPSVLKTAHNANFERVCLSKHFGTNLPIDQWECTMVKSAMLGLPFALGVVGKILKIDQEKMTEGKALIRYFSMPCKPTKANGMRTRNLPEHDMEKWNTYKLYNGRDVEAEREIREKTAFFKMHDGEKELYILDQVINDRGVMVDRQFVNNAIKMDATYKDRLTVEMTELTNLNNPNSVSQLKAWIAEETGEDVTSLTKEAILTMLKNTPSDEVSRVLRNRQEMAKTSVKKYNAMANAVGSDGRIRGLLQFYGANRTGRWAGRLVQVQNLPQNHLYDLDLARELVRENDLEMLEMLFGNVPDTLSQLIRTAFVAMPGNTFLVADFSAIEARVIAWLAGEKWRLDVFATHGKIYEASASQMFKVPIEEVTKGSPLRQKGKVSELALGYQGGPGALTQMGALKMGLQEDELQGLVDAWRAANPNIVRLWKTIDNAAKEAVENKALVSINHGIKFDCRAGVLFIELPSGRKLSYIHPRLGKNRFDSSSLIYEGMNQTTKQWCDQETYGGKLVENIVQAIARDCLAYAMINLDKAGYQIVMHVHDEAIIEIEEERANLKDVCKIMGQPIPWAKGLLLRADGYSTKYYRKD